MGAFDSMDVIDGKEIALQKHLLHPRSWPRSAMRCMCGSGKVRNVTQGPKTRRLSFSAFFIESHSTLNLLQNTFYSIKISCF